MNTSRVKNSFRIKFQYFLSKRKEKKPLYLLIYIFLILDISGKINCFLKVSQILPPSKYKECNNAPFPHLCSCHSGSGTFNDSFWKFYMMLSTGPRLLWNNLETHWFSIKEVWKFKLSSLWANGNFIHCICYLHGHIHMCTLLLLGNSELDSATRQGDA